MSRPLLPAPENRKTGGEARGNQDAKAFRHDHCALYSDKDDKRANTYRTARNEGFSTLSEKGCYF
ncbi:hypothetical protein DOTSEDRAFT_75829 [Dothistroma septosporum NZE10]|uniref:Uncharacterized protein n=1 Tax=Dothistroma septosporum (strain NZE10 / CBS 128990) TaxID=675120 RepID=N1PC96_DOTSN|nr:hypothetical protein DOTSEDRAFT_75829 [Dothistroma septosporum NZE10]